MAAMQIISLSFPFLMQRLLLPFHLLKWKGKLAKMEFIDDHQLLSLHNISHKIEVYLNAHLLINLQNCYLPTTAILQMHPAPLQHNPDMTFIKIHARWTECNTTLSKCVIAGNSITSLVISTITNLNRQLLCIFFLW